MQTIFALAGNPARQVRSFALVFNALIVAIAVAMASSASMAADKTVKIVAFGDSLTAGYGLQPGEAFPAQIERALRAKGHKVEVLNAGVSGDTTAAALDRLAWAVPGDADGVIVALGANDALRGLDPAAASANLDKIMTAIAAQKSDMLVAGMRAPRNLPPDYIATFDAVFPSLAAKHNALLYPFFIEATALKPGLNLADGMHPNARGVGAIVDAILPSVEQLLARIKARQPS